MKIVFTFFCIAMSIQTLHAQKGVVKKESEKTIPFYLAKTDPIFIAIKTKLINDLTQSAKSSDTANERNKTISQKLKTLPKERQDHYQETFIQSLYDYYEQIDFDFDLFMMLHNDLMKKDQKTLVNESDFRVQSIGGNNYAAELWEDLLLANSETHAVEWAKEILEHHPGDEKETITTVKATYAKARKDIVSGKQKRYNKITAFLYTKETDGSVLFHDPCQAMLDLKLSDIY